MVVMDLVSNDDIINHINEYHYDTKKAGHLKVSAWISWHNDIHKRVKKNRLLHRYFTPVHLHHAPSEDVEW